MTGTATAAKPSRNKGLRNDTAFSVNSIIFDRSLSDAFLRQITHSGSKEGSVILFTNATPEFPVAHPGDNLITVYFLEATELH
jgi:hypothetical protein